VKRKFHLQDHPREGGFQNCPTPLSPVPFKRHSGRTGTILSFDGQ
jgi:hypothetical protein